MDDYSRNLNYENIVLSDWPSAVLISALIGQCNRTVRVTRKYLDSTRYRAQVASKKLLNFARFNFKKA